METIRNDDALAERAAQMGWTIGQRGDPSVESLAGRYSYDPQAGTFTGPSGKVLKPLFEKRVNSWRIGVFDVYMIYTLSEL